MLTDAEEALMECEIIPSEVSREVWRMAQDRCQCTRPGCHGAPGRCTTHLGSGEGRVTLIDPRGPHAVWNCVLLCTSCLDTWARAPLAGLREESAPCPSPD